MKKLVTATLLALALTGPTLPHAAGPAPDDRGEPIAGLEGSGLLGTLGCYTCVFGAIGGSVGFPGIGDLLLERCYSYCAKAM